MSKETCSQKPRRFKSDGQSIRVLYNDPITADNTALSALAEGELGPEDTAEPDFLRSEIEMAVKKLKNGKAAGFGNIQAELLKRGGDDVIEALHKICDSVWQSGVWPLQWTRSLIIPLPKKGDLRKCNNYRTISLISHPGKVLLTVINNRLKSRAEGILAEEQAGFRSGRSTVEQITNVRILGEKYRNHQLEVHHNFVDFTKAFDTAWRRALWMLLRKHNFGNSLYHK